MNYKKLPDICNITTGKLDANAAVAGGAYPFFTCAPEPITIDSFAFDCDAILLAGNNAQGNFHITRYNGKFNAYQRTYVITAKDGYNIDFIKYMLELSLAHFKSQAQGSQTKFLTIQILNSFSIPDISLDEQIKTVGPLVVLDKKINNNNNACTELEAMAKILYDYWFVQFDFPDENGKPYRTSGGAMEWCQELGREVPKGWKAKRVSELTKVITGKEDANFSTADGEYKFFTCGQETLCCDTPAFTGKAVLIAGNGDFNVKHYTGSFNAYQRTYILIPNEDKYYAAMFIAAKDTIQSFRQGSNGSIVKFITKGDVENITLLSPTNDDLLQRLNGIIEQIELFEKENDELIKLRDWLLPMLMNGQAFIH